MKYSLEFESTAKKEWDKLDNTIKSMFKNVLQRILINPIVPKDRLHGTKPPECYKIKLRTLGYRLVYKVESDKLVLLIISVGKRENNEVYNTFHTRLGK